MCVCSGPDSDSVVNKDDHQDIGLWEAGKLNGRCSSSLKLWRSGHLMMDRPIGPPKDVAIVFFQKFEDKDYIKYLQFGVLPSPSTCKFGLTQY